MVVGLERLSQTALSPDQLFQSLAVKPRTVEILVSLFADSQFLTEIMLRSPEYILRLTDQKRLARIQSVDQFSVEPSAIVSAAPSLSTGGWTLYGAISDGNCCASELVICSNLFDLPTVTAQLSNLADSLIQACLVLASEKSQTPISSFVVIAMGKLGGRELNYSSDIDLLFIAMSDAPAFGQLGARLIEGLSQVTAEGFLYRTDMRLRPWGRVGALVSSVKGYMSYLDQSARLWEKQALLKARITAGSTQTGLQFLKGITHELPRIRRSGPRQRVRYENPHGSPSSPARS